jgi:hypothetical protein
MDIAVDPRRRHAFLEKSLLAAALRRGANVPPMLGQRKCITAQAPCREIGEKGGGGVNCSFETGNWTGPATPRYLPVVITLN